MDFWIQILQKPWNLTKLWLLGCSPSIFQLPQILLCSLFQMHCIFFFLSLCVHLIARAVLICLCLMIESRTVLWKQDPSVNVQHDIIHTFSCIYEHQMSILVFSFKHCPFSVITNCTDITNSVVLNWQISSKLNSLDLVISGFKVQISLIMVNNQRLKVLWISLYFCKACHPSVGKFNRIRNIFSA